MSWCAGGNSRNKSGGGAGRKPITTRLGVDSVRDGGCVANDYSPHMAARSGRGSKICIKLGRPLLAGVVGGRFFFFFFFFYWTGRFLK